MVIGLDVHKRSVYATVMEDNGTIISQKNMENNMEIVNEFLSVYKDHDIVIESSTSGKYLSRELLKLNYKIHLINPAKVPEIYNNYKKTDLGIKNNRIDAIYARVSSNNKNDLYNQINRLKSLYPNAQIFSDIKSGLKFNRKGFIELLNMIEDNRINNIYYT
ncbi:MULTISPECIES: transposase [unclassified Acidiplasma]|nr:MULTISPECIES: recombinase family protein [unclassified Acidiplasma]WMT54402.1 MAG: recombinase family protein [Acidiplasma sp.]